jgi:hypothetical protein
MADSIDVKGGPEIARASAGAGRASPGPHVRHTAAPVGTPAPLCHSPDADSGAGACAGCVRWCQLVGGSARLQGGRCWWRRLAAADRRCARSAPRATRRLRGRPAGRWRSRAPATRPSAGGGPSAQAPRPTAGVCGEWQSPRAVGPGPQAGIAPAGGRPAARSAPHLLQRWACARS